MLRGVAYIVQAAARFRANRVRTRGHRLRLERLERPAVIHFVRQNAVDIIFNIEMRDHVSLAAGDDELNIARIIIARHEPLRDFDGVIAAAAGMASERKARPHRLRGAALIEIHRPAGEADGNLRAVPDLTRRIAVDGIIARDGHGVALPRERRQPDADGSVVRGGIRRQRRGVQRLRRRRKGRQRRKADGKGQQNSPEPFHR